MAADAIVEGFEKNDLSEAQLGSWGPKFTKGMDGCVVWFANTTTASALAGL